MASLPPRFCDWRLGLDPGCPDQEFYHVVHIIYFSLVLSLGFFIGLSLLLRVFVLQEKASSFVRGSNASSVIFFLTNMAYIAHSGVLVFHGSRMTASALWGLLAVVSIAPNLNHVALVITATPGLKLTELRAPKFLLNKTPRTIFFAAFMILDTGLSVSISCLSEFYLQSGDLGLSTGLWMAWYLLSILVMIFWLLMMGYFSREFRLAVSARLKGIKGHLSGDREDFKLLELTVKQVVRIFYITLSLLPPTVLFYLVLAFYDGFFINAPFSKAFSVIYFCIAFLPLVFMIFGMYVAIFRQFEIKSGSKGRSSTSSSRKDESKMESLRDKSAVTDPMQDFLDRGEISAA